MSRLTLEFTLPEEREEADLAVRAGGYQRVLEDARQFVRSKLKYESLGEEAGRILEELQTLIHTEMVDEGIVDH